MVTLHVTNLFLINYQEICREKKLRCVKVKSSNPLSRFKEEQSIYLKINFRFPNASLITIHFKTNSFKKLCNLGAITFLLYANQLAENFCGDKIHIYVN